MFSLNHFIWLFICSAIIGISVYLIKKNKVSWKSLLNICCGVCIFSEATKVFSVIKIVPLATGGYAPYLESNHLPIHLCSIQIILIFLIRFIDKRDKLFHTLIAFMYPTTILGAFFALLLPSIFTTTISVAQAFSHPMAYQFFLYHTMLIILGVGIYHFFADEFNKRDLKNTLLIMSVVAFVSIYVNSMFATPNYVDGQLVSIEHSVNFFFTYQTPIGIELTSVTAWAIYLLIIASLGITLITAFYMPIIRRNK